MLDEITVREAIRLDQYEAEAQLASAVVQLRDEAARVAPLLRGRTVWMVNSTSHGGGVAEMLPRIVSLLNDVGVLCRWVVIRSDRAAFFALTKRIHNMIHGVDVGRLDESDRALYESVNRRNAEALVRRLGPHDIVVVHDPQPAALGAFAKRAKGVRTIFRSHIGFDEEAPSVPAAWDFLRPYVETYDACVFSAPEYVPPFLVKRAVTMPPSIDPWSHKNRELDPQKLMGILCNAGLAREVHPVLTPRFDDTVTRIDEAGRDAPDDIGMPYRPIVTQVSRWDHLKGFVPLLHGFARLKAAGAVARSARDARRISLVRLVLAGPDPASIQDDPEAHEVLRTLRAACSALPTAIQRDVAILSLPMSERKQNELIVNALQRCSSLIVQNSLREGFGLTVTEAMWKRVPVLGTRAHGLRMQLRDGVDGVLTTNPEDPSEIAARLEALLSDDHRREALGSAGQRRVHAEFLVFSQVRAWLSLFASLAEDTVVSHETSANEARP